MGSKLCARQHQLCALRDAKLKVVADSKLGNTSIKGRFQDFAVMIIEYRLNNNRNRKLLCGILF